MYSIKKKKGKKIVFTWRKKPHSELGTYIKTIKENKFVNINSHVPVFSSVWGCGGMSSRDIIIGPGTIFDKINNGLY